MNEKHAKEYSERSQNVDRLTHGSLDVNTLEIVPSLFQQGCQEVESHDDVLSELLIVHTLVTDGNIHASDLLELPLNGSSDIIELLGKRLSMGDWLWESTDSVNNWSKNDWDLLDERIGGEEK